MKKSLLFTVAVVMQFLLVTGANAADNFLADRHVQKGANCLTCHKSEQPKLGDEPESEVCLKCHPREVIVEKFSPLEKQNPHKNHLGDVDCVVCHKGHEQSRAYCLECHKSFQMEMK